MKFWEDTPSRSDLRDRLNTDLKDKGNLTLQETLDKGNGTMSRGDPDPGTLSRRAIHADVLPVAHRNEPGFLAEELCSHGNS